MAKVRYRGETPVELLGRWRLKKGDTVEIPDEYVNTTGNADDGGFTFAEPLWSVVDAPARKTSTSKAKDEGASSTPKPATKAGSDDAKGE